VRSSVVSLLAQGSRVTLTLPVTGRQSDPHSDGYHNDSSLGIAFHAQHQPDWCAPLTSHSFNNSEDRLISLLFFFLPLSFLPPPPLGYPRPCVGLSNLHKGAFIIRL